MRRHPGFPKENTMSIRTVPASAASRPSTNTFALSPTFTLARIVSGTWTRAYGASPTSNIASGEPTGAWSPSL